MSAPTPGPAATTLHRSRIRHRRDGGPRPLRPPVRPLDDGTTEVVRVIEFVLPAGAAIQPVLWLDRELLN